MQLGKSSVSSSSVQMLGQIVPPMTGTRLTFYHSSYFITAEQEVSELHGSLKQIRFVCLISVEAIKNYNKNMATRVESRRNRSSCSCMEALWGQ